MSELTGTATEIVWDREGTATATSGTCVLPAGPGTAWPAPMLLATAASASLLTTFLDLTRAEAVTLHGYVAQQTPVLHPGGDDIEEIAITVCISVPSEGEAARARALWATARRTAPVLRALRCRVVCESHVVVLGEVGADPAPE